MKRTMFILLIATLALSGAAMAQGFQDILGPHNLNGHGCATCHTPHTGAQGNGGTDASTGTNYLWGRDFFPNSYTTIGGGTLVTTATYTDTDPLFHTAACLSCHDGNVTIAGMTGQSFETVDGKKISTYLNKDGYSLTNDHPVHVTYTPGGYNWPGTVDATGKVVWSTTDAGTVNFTNTYGRPIRFYGVAGTTGSAYVECSTCHNPHSMNWARYSISGVASVKPSRMFVRGWYDSANTASNSATQFCRSCHYSKSNEYAGINSVTN
jgi:cytochrome c551/c552